MNSPAVVLKDVDYCFDVGQSCTIQEVTLTIQQGDWIAIAGPSGSGKSTLVQLLCGYLPRVGGGIRTGELLIDGIDPAHAEIYDLANRIGVVFQDPDAQMVIGRVEDEVAFGPENLQCPVEEIEERVTAALEEVDFAHRRMDQVHLLSGGGKQRVVIASVLSLRTPIIVLDEPIASLDSKTRRRVISMLHKLHAEGRTIITVSGRVDDLAASAPRLVIMKDGKVLLDGSKDHILNKERPSLEQWGLLPMRELDQDLCKGANNCGDAGNNLLEIHNLSFNYNRGYDPVLHNVNVSLGEGQLCLLCGENGSGKTTLSRLIIGLLTAPKGTIWWQGRDISRLSAYKRAAEMGYVFQQPEQQFVCSTVLEEMMYGPTAASDLTTSKDLTEAELRAHDLMELIGVTNKGRLSPYLLSGGEKKLLSVAASFMMPKKLYILDEPTAGIDYDGIGKLIALCRQALHEGASILIITHEPEWFRDQFNNVSIWNIDRGTISTGTVTGV